MKRSLFALVALTMSFPLVAEAAIKNFPIKTRLTIIENGHKRYERQTNLYPFKIEVISDSEGTKSETWLEGSPFVTAKPKERYAVRLHNPLPVRVAVNLSVDGLNSITGKPSGIADGSKWIIEPHSYIVIRGWQVNPGELRRFFFTEKPKSYPKWRSKDFPVDLSQNCGVIGASFFWSRKELRRYYDNHPIYRNPTPKPYQEGRKWDMTGGARERSLALPQTKVESDTRDESEQKAGTGMGERESHPTQHVNFKYDTGMYKVSQALLVYYDFEKTFRPSPFPGLSFAPEAP